MASGPPDPGAERALAPGGPLFVPLAGPLSLPSASSLVLGLEDGRRFFVALASRPDEPLARQGRAASRGALAAAAVLLREGHLRSRVVGVEDGGRGAGADTEDGGRGTGAGDGGAEDDVEVEPAAASRDDPAPGSSPSRKRPPTSAAASRRRKSARGGRRVSDPRPSHRPCGVCVLLSFAPPAFRRGERALRLACGIGEGLAAREGEEGDVCPPTGRSTVAAPPDDPDAADDATAAQAAYVGMDDVIGEATRVLVEYWLGEEAREEEEKRNAEGKRENDEGGGEWSKEGLDEKREERDEEGPTKGGRGGGEEKVHRLQGEAGESHLDETGKGGADEGERPPLPVPRVLVPSPDAPDPLALDGLPPAAHPSSASSLSFSSLSSSAPWFHNPRERVFACMHHGDWTDDAPDPPGLRSHLFKYQQRCLAWMLWREGRREAPPGARATRADVAARTLGAAVEVELPGLRGAAVEVELPGLRGVAVKDELLGPDAFEARSGGKGSRQDEVEKGVDSRARETPPKPPPVHHSGRVLFDPVIGAVADASLPGTSERERLERALEERERKASTGGPNLAPACLSVPSLSPPVPLGGLLCDEMGLGKTVEMIALILANPRPATATGAAARERQENGSGSSTEPSGGDEALTPVEGRPSPPSDASPPELNSPPVVKDEASPSARPTDVKREGATIESRKPPRSPTATPPASPLPSSPSSLLFPGGTLVVCPPALVQQWTSELSNHAGGALTVEVYEGLSELEGFGAPADADPGAWKPPGSRRPARADGARARGRGGGGAGGASSGTVARPNAGVPLLASPNAPPAPSGSAPPPPALPGGRPSPAVAPASARASAPSSRRASARSLPRLPPSVRAEQELAMRLAAGLPLGGASAEDVEAAVRGLARRLAAADVVVVSLAVLRAEAHFSPEASASRSLRREKRYAVPTCPLLLVGWWRTVVDEAQAVGPFSAAASVLARCESRRRWAVTGTPLGGSREVDDCGALLGAVGAVPLGDSVAFRRAVVAPLAAGLRPDLAWRLLSRSLAPLSWRCDKRQVALEQPLPPRSLELVPLRFTAGEREFYSLLLEQSRQARLEVQRVRLEQVEKERRRRLLGLERRQRAEREKRERDGGGAGDGGKEGEAGGEAASEGTAEGDAGGGTGGGAEAARKRTKRTRATDLPAIQPPDARATTSGGTASDDTAHGNVATGDATSAASFSATVSPATPPPPAAPSSVDPPPPAAPPPVDPPPPAAPPSPPPPPEAPPTSPRHPPPARRGRRSELVRAMEEETTSALQLRLACIHPQLTRHWKRLSGDLQLGAGGTLSMSEIMARLADGAAQDLQALERAYCAAANTYAHVCMEKAEAARAKAGGKTHGRGARADKGERREAQEEAGRGDEAARGAVRERGEDKGKVGRTKEDAPESPTSPRPISPTGNASPAKPPASPRRATAAPRATPPPPTSVVSPIERQLLSEALSALESSFRVAEKGIGAIDLPTSAIWTLPDIPATSSSTVTAWKLLQLNTAVQLRAVRERLGDAEGAEAAVKDADDKRRYVRSGAELEVSVARSKRKAAESAARGAVGRAREAFMQAEKLGWPSKEAKRASEEDGRGPEGPKPNRAPAAGSGRGAPPTTVPGDPIGPDLDAFLAQCALARRVAAEEEARELSAQRESSHVAHMLGTRVAKAIGEIEARVATHVAALERRFAAEEVLAATADVERRVDALKRAQADQANPRGRGALEEDAGDAGDRAGQPAQNAAVCGPLVNAENGPLGSVDVLSDSPAPAPPRLVLSSATVSATKDASETIVKVLWLLPELVRRRLAVAWIDVLPSDAAARLTAPGGARPRVAEAEGGGSANAEAVQEGAGEADEASRGDARGRGDCDAAAAADGGGSGGGDAEELEARGRQDGRESGLDAARDGSSRPGSSGAARAPTAAKALIRARFLAKGRVPFIASPVWLGEIAGYVFTTAVPRGGKADGETGVGSAGGVAEAGAGGPGGAAAADPRSPPTDAALTGYHLDRPPEVARELEPSRVLACAQAVLRALGEHAKRQDRAWAAAAVGREAPEDDPALAAGPGRPRSAPALPADARGALEALPSAAAGARAVGCRALLAALRAWRDEHVASAQLRLREEQLEDVDASLRKAEVGPPERHGTKEGLLRRMAAAKQAAVEAASKRRFLLKKLQEAEEEEFGVDEDEGAGEEDGEEQASEGGEDRGRGGAGLGGGRAGGKSAELAERSGVGSADAGTEAGVLDEAATPGSSTAAPASRPPRSASPSPSSPKPLSTSPAPSTQAQQAQPSSKPGPSPTSAPSVPPSSDPDADECPICYVPLSIAGEAYVFGSCGHAFCADCATQQVIGAGTCALCREKVTRKQVFRVAVAGHRKKRSLKSKVDVAGDAGRRREETGGSADAPGADDAGLAAVRSAADPAAPHAHLPALDRRIPAAPLGRPGRRRLRAPATDPSFDLLLFSPSVGGPLRFHPNGSVEVLPSARGAEETALTPTPIPADRGGSREVRHGSREVQPDAGSPWASRAFSAPDSPPGILGSARPSALLPIPASLPRVRGEWSAKIAALVRRLLALSQLSPHEKSLVFSQHPAALQLVSLALKANGIRHASLGVGGRGTVAARDAVSAFRECDDVRVFLLSHRAGAAGLTLTRANHVFLLEPSLDPGLEQQAVARVHRVGQRRPVRIHRLVIQGSIEQAVLARAEAKALLVARHAKAGGAEGGAAGEDKVPASPRSAGGGAGLPSPSPGPLERAKYGDSSSAPPLPTLLGPHPTVGPSAPDPDAGQAKGQEGKGGEATTLEAPAPRNERADFSEVEGLLDEVL